MIKFARLFTLQDYSQTPRILPRLLLTCDSAQTTFKIVNRIFRYITIT
jgi:hypothetical protein